MVAVDRMMQANAISSAAMNASPLGPTFSDQWYRVADLHPRLHAHVRMNRHSYRGDIWHVLDDPISGRQHRINPLAWALVARLDGQQPLRQIWDTVVAEHGGQAPTQPEVMALLGQLHEHGLLASEGRPDLNGLFAQQQRRQRRERGARSNPLAFRVPLANPTPWLTHCDALARMFFNPTTLALWGVLVLLALLLAGTEAGSLQAYATRHLGSPQQLLVLWLVFPVVKALHEAAHALAVRRWGGEVAEVGVTLMLLMPVPYVDASAASAFRHRRHRVAVSLAGIAAELALAALAVLVWLQVADGLVREVAFAVMLTGGVSTLLFNGNPLVRMDAYYALTDVLESPGLAPRSRAYLLYLARRWLLRLQQARPPVVARGEERWLVGYGLAATVYQGLLAVVLVGWLLGVHLVLGVLAWAWFMVVMVLMPLRRLWRWVRTAPELASQRGRAWLAAALLAAMPLFLLLALPLPASTRAQGVVWLPDNAVARAQGEGLVQRVWAADGDVVQPGTPLLRLSDPMLDTELQALQSRRRGVAAAQQQALFNQSPQASALTEQLAQLRAEEDRLLQRLDQLTVRAGSAGRLVLPRAADLPGSWVARGAVVAHVLPPGGGLVRVVVPQDDVARLGWRPPDAASSAAAPSGLQATLQWALQSSLQKTPVVAPVLAQVRLANSPTQVHRARVLTQTPAATRELPSVVLGDRGNGPFLTDPADPRALRTLEPVFTLDLALPDSAHNAAVQQPGMRAWVRFDHGAQPLARQWLHRAQQLFIGRLASSGA
jgi:putative peptide zinc metalloprotease protein